MSFPSILLAQANHLPLLTTIAAAFAAAWALGLVTQRLGLSPIVGYLLAGMVIGPYTPGFVGDASAAQQLAEVGVILLMFGVGLHFHLKDLVAVKGIALPGAIGQSLVAMLLSAWVFGLFGWPLKPALVLGMAMAVASTVVLLRVLLDRGMLNSVHGHVAVGWLIVEDIFTVLALVFVPILAANGQPSSPGSEAPGLATVGWALLKLCALIAIVLVAGSRVVPWVLAQVAKLRSRELFTLTVLVLSVTIAVGSATLFGSSVALGAFLAGLVVAQSPVSHQAAADALPMRDAFAVLFFVSVGMLFDPAFLIQHPLMVASGLIIVLGAKPLAALAIVAVLGFPARTALTVAIGLAQIGEFSFILAQVAGEHGLMPEDGRSLLVAVAMISIALNPLLFRHLDRIEGALRRRPALWRLLSIRAQHRTEAINAIARAEIARNERPLAVIVGYGPVGRVVDALLRDAKMQTVIIEMNMETVQSLRKSGHSVIYGDATRPEILHEAGVGRAVNLVVTLPHSAGRNDLILAARELNPEVEITVRAHYLNDRDSLRAAGANKVVFEEGEVGIALARHVMERRGVDPTTVEKMLGALRSLWRMNE
ncbi:Putative cation/proton antiporter YbaL [Phycisphaerales bacterium]|nr:Putative cation/proton antiporter YbaL [Phycisphaerales bacterium]